MFSLPVNFLLKPTPIDNNEIVWPCKSIEPLSGLKIPAIALNIVDLPLPFLPIIPNILPSSISKLTPFNASNTSTFSLIFVHEALIEVFFRPR